MFPIHFAQPLWLLIGTGVCLMVSLFIRLTIVRRQQALQHFASAHLLPSLTSNVSPGSRFLKNILFVLALACLFVALARPQYGHQWIEVSQKGIDILIGFDVSKSMLARDLTPNRMERAKLAVRDFISQLDGDRVGLLPFAGTAFLMCPLTTDYEALTTSLDAMDVHVIPQGGTDIGAAITKAAQVLQNEANHKILVLLTDGEDLRDNALQAAIAAKDDKMTIFTIGVGTPQGELIPASELDNTQFIKDKTGHFVTSKLDETALKTIAETTGGMYVPLGNMGQGLATIYQKRIAGLQPEEHKQRKRKIPIERFAWPLGAALVLLIIDFLITGRKSSWALRLPFIKTEGRRVKSATALLFLFLLCHGVPQALASAGEQFFAGKQFSKAEQFYKKQLKTRPDDPQLNYNLGTAAYKNKQYKVADTAFTKALHTDDLELQQKSYYNHGNTLYKMGQAAKKTDPEQTAKLWQQSLDSYKASQALAANDNDMNAAIQHNLEIVKRKLALLKKQQQKKTNKNQQQKKNRQNTKKKNSSNHQNNPKEQAAKNKKTDKKQTGNKQPSSRQQKDHKNGASPRQPGKTKQQNEGQKAPVPQKTPGKKQGKNQQTTPAAMNARDLQRRQQGKMTREEAENMLNSLKGEQKELTFIPQGDDTQNTERDW